MDVDNVILVNCNNKDGLYLIKAMGTGYLIMFSVSCFKMFAEPEGGVGSRDADLDVCFKAVISLKEFLLFMGKHGTLSEMEVTDKCNVLQSVLMNLEDYGYKFARRVAMPEGYPYGCQVDESEVV